MPTRTSTSPLVKAARVLRCSAPLRKRETMPTLTGRSAKRPSNVIQCCSARMVVGTSTSVCLPASAALKAARSATSVLP